VPRQTQWGRAWGGWFFFAFPPVNSYRCLDWILLQVKLRLKILVFNAINEFIRRIKNLEKGGPQNNTPITSQ
jgi:hypothetical protein